METYQVKLVFLFTELIPFTSVAGSETTASSLAALTNFLLRNPRCYAKVKEEIRTRFKSEDEITLSAMDDLVYMNACLEEGLRFFPPAPIGFLRTIQEQGDVVDGHHLPGGVSAAQIPSSLLALTANTTYCRRLFR